MNARTLAHMLGMSQQSTQRLEQAWGQAMQAAQGVSSFQDAKKVTDAMGINNSIICKASNLLNNPLANVVAAAVGINLDSAKKALHMLSSPTTSVAQTNNDMDILRNGLNQLRGWKR